MKVSCKVKRAIAAIVIAAGGLVAQEHLCVRDLVIPDYPALARMARLQGKVVLDIQVLPNGHVGDVKASGPKLLRSHAAANVRKWTFESFPAASKFPIHHRIVYVYKLEGKPTEYPAATFVFHLPDYVEIVTHPSVQFD